MEIRSGETGSLEYQRLQRAYPGFRSSNILHSPRLFYLIENASFGKRRRGVKVFPAASKLVQRDVHDVSKLRIHQSQSYIGPNGTDVLHEFCEWAINADSGC